MRWLGFAIVLLLLLVLSVLGPPHWQIRQIEPVLPDASDFRALTHAQDRPIRVAHLLIADQHGEGPRMGHVVFLAEWADGRIFMIDAGMDEAGAADFAELMELTGFPGEHRFVGELVEQLGSGNVDRVAGVGFTHLHIDHTQGLEAFCDARGPGAQLYQTNWQSEETNLHTREGAAILAGSCLQSASLPAPKQGLYSPPEFPGLGIAALGGHTPGSTLFAIAGPERLWLLAGDTTNVKQNLTEDRGKGFVYSYLMVPENTTRTALLRQWLAKLDRAPDLRVLVSHDIDDTLASGLPAWTP